MKPHRETKQMLHSLNSSVADPSDFGVDPDLDLDPRIHDSD